MACFASHVGGFCVVWWVGDGRRVWGLFATNGVLFLCVSNDHEQLKATPATSSFFGDDLRLTERWFPMLAVAEVARYERGVHGTS